MFKVVFQVLPYVFGLMLMGAFVWPAGLKVRAQAIWAMVFLLCASKFVCFRVLGGDVFNPELPELFIWTWNWAYSGMCILLALALPWALVRVCARRARWAAGWRVYGRIALPVLAWTFSLCGLYNGIRPPEVVEVPIVCAKLPAELEGYRILHITDTHVSAAARQWRTEKIVARANAAAADLIVCTGDIVDGLPRHQARNVRPLCDLRAKDGVYFVTGNHEYYSDYWEWNGQFIRWDLHFLHNEWVSPRAGLVVAGVDDPAGNFNPTMERFGSFPSLRAAFAGAPKDAFRVLLQHRPYVNFEPFGEIADEPYDLQLSGHTHGGIAPVLRGLVESYNNGFVRGLYRLENGGQLYVSPGAGQWAGFPIRFFNDPEITVFTLHRSVEDSNGRD